MLKELQTKYGPLAGTKPGYDCLQNAIHNTALALYSNRACHILYVPSVKHAYLSDGKQAYSKGLTWPDNQYPELSLKEIFDRKGYDATTLMFWQALEVTEDVVLYHCVLNRLASNIPDIKIAMARIFGV